jgi:hypothetical protein
MIQITAGILIRPALVRDRQATNGFHHLESAIAAVIAHRFAQDPAEEAYIAMERAVPIDGELSVGRSDVDHCLLQAIIKSNLRRLHVREGHIALHHWSLQRRGVQLGETLWPQPSLPIGVFQSESLRCWPTVGLVAFTFAASSSLVTPFYQRGPMYGG